MGLWVLESGTCLICTAPKPVTVGPGAVFGLVTLTIPETPEDKAETPEVKSETSQDNLNPLRMPFLDPRRSALKP